MTQRTTEPRILSERTERTYAAAWALFSDWCAVTGDGELPADPATVIAFLADCPAAPKTHRGWVAAIDHRHTATGHPPPGRSVAVLAALGRPTGEPRQVPIETAAAVEAALRALPSHGWTQGMFGRRDRCLLVLSQLAGVPYKHLARLTAGDVTVADGAAKITTAALTWTLRSADDGVLCGPCAVTRWLRILNLVVTRPSHAEIARALKRTKPTTNGSPHLCRSHRALDDATLGVPLLPPIDQWGYVPFPVQRLSRTRCPAASGTCSVVTWVRIGTCPSTPTTYPNQPRRRHLLSRGRCTAGRTCNRPGRDVVPISRNWPASMTTSPISSAGPTNSTAGQWP
jgi:hypothetical protein